MRPDDLLRIELLLDGPVAVLALHGELDLATAALLPEALGRVARSARRRLLVDLRAVTILDSTGVRSLLHVRRWMVNRDGDTRFVCSPKPVGRTLALMGLYDALGMTEDYSGALAALGSVAGGG